MKLTISIETIQLTLFDCYCIMYHNIYNSIIVAQFALFVYSIINAIFFIKDRHHLLSSATDFCF